MLLMVSSGVLDLPWVSLCGWRLKGKGKGVLAVRETRGAFLLRLKLPFPKLPFPFPFKTPATQATPGGKVLKECLGMEKQLGP